MSRSSRPNDEPVPLADALAGVSRDLGLPDPAQLSAVLEAWPDLVGPEIARRAHVRSLRDGVLLVAVEEPAFATHVRYLEQEVCDGVARVVGQRVVRSLRVVVQPAGKPRREPPVW